MTTEDSSALDPSHSLWVEARKQLNEYELRTSELQLDLQHALRGNQQARDALARMNKEENALKTRRAQHDVAETQEMRAVQALKDAREAEMLDTQRLVQQLSMAQQKLAQLQAQAEEERKVWEAHVREQEEHNKGLEAFLLAQKQLPSTEEV